MLGRKERMMGVKCLENSSWATTATDHSSLLSLSLLRVPYCLLSLIFDSETSIDLHLLLSLFLSLSFSLSRPAHCRLSETRSGVVRK